ncbi:PfkB domain-containing protein [Rhizoctonia solani AG-1 IA]|uniref:PfkB domain-containing protein n=1 Tax=Thanatephorus cucumeris (strain AG1-IA) TaxID=983506 RepID=L8X236_THACA|nr:PfkB domain-containing protein [Rhizoctonia solani AG-1 IA]
MPKQFVSLGLFILDEFEFLDATGEPTGKILPTQVGGGGTYAAVGARIWLPASEIGQIVDRGFDFPAAVQRELDHYGPDMCFEYLTPRIRLTPKDLAGTPLESPRQIHFVCSPTRAYQIMQDADTYGVKDWKPFVIYEPIPFRCVPEELPALRQILHRVDILSPNAEEALGLLSIDKAGAYDYSVIEYAAARLLSFGVGKDASGHVIIRCGAMGAYAAKREGGIVRGWWTPAYWGPEDKGAVVDVTGKINHFGHDGTPTGTFVPGAGNAFLGGLSAGLSLTNGDVREGKNTIIGYSRIVTKAHAAILYATVSAGYTIQQLGLPRVEYKDSGTVELWNGDRPKERLAFLRYRCADLK